MGADYSAAQTLCFALQVLPNTQSYVKCGTRLVIVRHCSARLCILAVIFFTSSTDDSDVKHQPVDGGFHTQGLLREADPHASIMSITQSLPRQIPVLTPIQLNQKDSK